MISYSWGGEWGQEETSRHIARAVADHFGNAAWIDVKKLLPGMPVSEACRAAASNCTLALAFVSNSYLKSPICLKELSTLKKHAEFLLVFVHSDTDRDIVAAEQSVKQSQSFLSNAVQLLEECHQQEHTPHTNHKVNVRNLVLHEDEILNQSESNNYKYSFQFDDGSVQELTLTQAISQRDIGGVASSIESFHKSLKLAAETKLQSLRLLEELQERIITLEPMKDQLDMSVFGSSNWSPDEFLLQFLCQRGILTHLFQKSTPAINSNWSATAACLTKQWRFNLIFGGGILAFIIFECSLVWQLRFSSPERPILLTCIYTVQFFFVFALILMFSKVHGFCLSRLYFLPDIVLLFTILQRLEIAKPKGGISIRGCVGEKSEINGLYYETLQVENTHPVFIKDDMSLKLACTEEGQWAISPHEVSQTNSEPDSQKTILAITNNCDPTSIEQLNNIQAATWLINVNESFQRDFLVAAQARSMTNNRFRIVTEGACRWEFALLEKLGVCEVLQSLSPFDEDSEFVDLHILNLDHRRVRCRRVNRFYWTAGSFVCLPPETQTKLADDLVATDQNAGPEFEAIMSNLLFNALHLSSVSGITVGQTAWKSLQRNVLRTFHEVQNKGFKPLVMTGSRVRTFLHTQANKRF
eukprot:m.153712 g.153712  ORF g.153712 m.153712 type:complete len:641 (+) comp24600_c0_seq1:565-2487(+)